MEYITIQQASKKFNLSTRSIRNYCNQGRIPGAKLSGKTWLIPKDSKKPIRKNSVSGKVYNSNSYISDMISFIDRSPVSICAINNVKEILLKNDYTEVYEYNLSKFKIGGKYFITRNDSSLIAFNIGEEVLLDKVPFHIVASHADSPCFKIKPNADGVLDKYNKVNVAPYGGLIASTWIDRPLGVAGRVVLSTNDGIETKIVNLSDLTLMIPNLCIHFNREINNGYQYNMAVDLQPFLSSKDDSSFVEALANRLGVDNDKIVNFDLYLYNKQGGVIWGENDEFISSPRLDDLECVYTSLIGFIEGENKNAINTLYISDNEEVGSLSRQGADSDFLYKMMERVCNSLGTDLENSIANSFIVSADNAHAVHPNKPQITDADNKAYMNKGIVIKFNASQTYTSDGISSAIFQKICENSNVPYQFFTNRSDLRGGSTLGNILLSHLSFMAVDVGLPQLAMHSSFETAGAIDVKYAINAFKEFYSTDIVFGGNTFKLKSTKK